MIFGSFREVCYKVYGLDCNYYYTAPGLSWDALLKISKCNIELLTDYDMLLMFEKGVRGGISQICHRYSEANNKYMKNYDKTKDDIYLLYLDANNLYGDAMMEYLRFYIRVYFMYIRVIVIIFNKNII